MSANLQVRCGYPYSNVTLSITDTKSNLTIHSYLEQSIYDVIMTYFKL